MHWQEKLSIFNANSKAKTFEEWFSELTGEPVSELERPDEPTPK